MGVGVGVGVGVVVVVVVVVIAVAVGGPSCLIVRVVFFLPAAGVRNRRLSHSFPAEPRQDTAVLKSERAGCWDLFFRPRMPTPYMSAQLVEEA